MSFFFVVLAIDTKPYIDDETMQSNETMICLNDESYLTEDDKSVQRTISSSSSEQLIPKEKQTGKRTNFF
jgi:hypothetical protein